MFYFKLNISVKWKWKTMKAFKSFKLHSGSLPRVHCKPLTYISNLFLALNAPNYESFDYIQFQTYHKISSPYRVPNIEVSFLSWVSFVLILLLCTSLGEKFIVRVIWRNYNFDKMRQRERKNHNNVKKDITNNINYFQ